MYQLQVHVCIITKLGTSRARYVSGEVEIRVRVMSCDQQVM